MIKLRDQVADMRPAFDAYEKTLTDALAAVVKFVAALGMIPGLRLPGVNSNPGMTRRRKRELIAKLRR